MSSIESTTFVLAVQDLAASTRYYTEVLGFERDPIDAEGWSFLSRQSWHVRLGECTDAVPAGELGDHSFYAYIQVSDARALYTDVKSRGAEIIADVEDKPWGMREFGIRTIDGHRILFGEEIRPGKSEAAPKDAEMP